MPLNTTGRNKLLDSGKAAFTHVTALIDLSGTAVAGARQAVSWAAAASGAAATSGAISIPIASGEAPMVLGLFDALSAGNLLGYVGMGSSAQKKGVGTAAIDDTITSNAHGLADTNRVFVWAVNGESLPTGLSATTLYYVVSAATNTFKLSLTSGGAAVDITAVGELAWSQTTPESAYGSSGTLEIASGALVLDGTFA